MLQFYSYLTTPGPENGVEMLRVLRHWRCSGLAGDTIAAYAKLRTNNIEDVKQSIHLFGACYIGVELPKFITGAADISQPRWAMRAEGTAADGALTRTGVTASRRFRTTSTTWTP